MFAVVEIAGKQYRVTENQQFEVDLLDTKDGETLSFDKVVLLAPTDTEAVVGQPYIKGASVKAKVVTQLVKGEKIRVFKFIAKKRHSKTQGHRQKYTLLQVTGIKA